MKKKLLILAILVSISIGTHVYSTEYQVSDAGFMYIINPLVLHSPDPANGSGKQPLNPDLSIVANHLSGDLMTISFWTNASGLWQILGGYHEGYNRTYTDTNATDMNNHDETYYWSVNCTDGTYFRNETYHFKTRK